MLKRCLSIMPAGNWWKPARGGLTAIMLAGFCSDGRAQQIFPPGMFSIDGFPVSCGPLPTVISPQVPDAAMNNGQAIFINPMIVGGLPTVLKLFVYGHECGHAFVGPDEIGADCWSVTTGKHQGWFPPQAFGLLIQMFQNNPGNINHPPGPVRIQAMMNCYQNN